MTIFLHMTNNIGYGVVYTPDSLSEYVAALLLEEFNKDIPTDITDMPKVMEYGVMSMPVLVVEEKIAAQGKVLKTAEIVKLLGKMGF